jgi:hypothetical protein
MTRRDHTALVGPVRTTPTTSAIRGVRRASQQLRTAVTLPCAHASDGRSAALAVEQAIRIRLRDD